MSRPESHGFIMWPRCARTFPLSSNLPVLQWRLATRGFIFCQHVHANTSRPLLIGTDSLSGKIQPSPPELLAPAVVSCQPGAGREGAGGAGGMKGGARKKEGHTLLRLITGTSAEQWPLCVYMWRIISDKAILASPLLVPPCCNPSCFFPSLSLCTQRPLPRWMAEPIRAGKRVQEGEKQQKVIRRKQWGLWLLISKCVHVVSAGKHPKISHSS